MTIMAKKKKKVFEKEKHNNNGEIDIKRKCSKTEFQVHKVRVNVNYLP